MRRRAALLSLVFAVGLVGCNPQEQARTPAAPSAGEATAATPVRTVQAQPGRLDTLRSVSATLAAATDSVVVAEQSGRVVALEKRAGDRVSRGQTVLRLEDATLRNQLRDARLALEGARVSLRTLERQNPEDLAQATSRVIALRTALENAVQTRKANERLFALGGVSGLELRTSRAGEQQARVELEGAQGTLDRAGRAGGEGLAAQRLTVQQAQNRVVQLEGDLNNARVVAPFAGEIVETFAQTGEFLPSGSRAFRLIDPTRLKVRFSVPPSEATRLALGQAVLLRLGDQTVSARISRHSGVSGENRMVALEAQPGKALTGVRSGTTGRLTYRVTLAQGLRLPIAALRFSGDRRSVFTVEGGRSVARTVRVLGDAGGDVAIQGIPAGSQVIFPVPGGLLPGRPVKVVQP